MKEQRTIAFIGAGNMGEALIRGVLRAKLFSAGEIIAAEPRPERRRELSEQLGIMVTPDNREAVGAAATVVIAVKPQEIEGVMDEIGAAIRPEQLLISIMAGISTASLERKLRRKVPVVRAMPNTPALVSAGVAAICKGSSATEVHLRRAAAVLRSVGKVVRVPEGMMNSVTAVSGSGPAYVCLLTEALATAARELGIGKETAARLAKETVIGTGRLMAEAGESPAHLRQKVTSPGGTTEAALKVFAGKGFSELVRTAVAAAERRAGELGKEGGSG